MKLKRLKKRYCIIKENEAVLCDQVRWFGSCGGRRGVRLPGDVQEHRVRGESGRFAEADLGANQNGAIRHVRGFPDDIDADRDICDEESGCADRDRFGHDHAPVQVFAQIDLHERACDAHPVGAHEAEAQRDELFLRVGDGVGCRHRFVFFPVVNKN